MTVEVRRVYTRPEVVSALTHAKLLRDFFTCDSCGARLAIDAELAGLHDCRVVLV